MRYEKSANGIKISVDSRGAELKSAVVDGVERLWQNETGEWSGSAPVLFPVCGSCEMKVDGRVYPLLPHGFAKRSEFTKVDEGENFLLFELRANGETEAVYPFDFALRVRYELVQKSVLVGYGVRNLGEKPLYFSCGGHESFALGEALDGYELLFEREETFVHLQHDERGKLTGETEYLGSGRVLPLDGAFFQEGRTLILGNINSRSVLLRKRTGETVAQSFFDGFPNLLLWRPGNARMICIEPWLNLPDGEERKEFSQKTGVQRLEAGETHIFRRKIVYGSTT